MLMNTYRRLPLRPTHGEGCWLMDERGQKYLDALAGVAVNTLGHAHPLFTRALKEQIDKAIHTSNIYTIHQQESLGEKLTELSGMDEAFFCNSGCEANEAAIKLARLYGHSKGVELPTIVVMDRAFHGRTLATLSAGGNRAAQAGFEPLTRGFIRVPYNDIQALNQVSEHSSSVVAVLYEAIQGEGGIHLADGDYQRFLRRLCDEKGWLLMADEVQCGIGRTGRWFGFQWSDIKPDVFTLAKGLGSGVPIGACLARGPAAGLFQPGKHGSTFGGNPLACTAGLATLTIIEEDDLVSHAAQMGERLMKGLHDRLGTLPGVVGVRGHGLMVGIELNQPCQNLVTEAMEKKHLLINVTAEKVIRLLPPLIMSEDLIDAVVHRLHPLVEEFLAKA